MQDNSAHIAVSTKHLNFRCAMHTLFVCQAHMFCLVCYDHLIWCAGRDKDDTPYLVCYDHLIFYSVHVTTLNMFFSGVGGTGKSFLIETIRSQVAAIWEDCDYKLTCAIAAPTGLAAFNVGDGVTIHRLLQLPIEHESNTA